MKTGVSSARILLWVLPILILAVCVYLNVAYRRSIVRLAPEIGAGAVTAAECSGWPFPIHFHIRDDERVAYNEGYQRMLRGEKVYDVGHLNRGSIWDVAFWLIAIGASAIPAMLVRRGKLAPARPAGSEAAE